MAKLCLFYFDLVSTKSAPKSEPTETVPRTRAAGSAGFMWFIFQLVLLCFKCLINIYKIDFLKSDQNIHNWSEAKSCTCFYIFAGVMKHWMQWCQFDIFDLTSIINPMSSKLLTFHNIFSNIFCIFVIILKYFVNNWNYFPLLYN